MKSKIYSIFLLFICIYTSNLNAQSKLANKWYLGVNAGIDFNTNPISTFYNKNINTIESSSSICDSNGNMLLYTDGNTLWNKYDSIVENGDKTLLADQSSTQGVMILNHPDNDSIYYIVTTSGGSQSYYSILNIKANNNKGKIIKLNIPLVSDGEEKLAATAHGNGKDIWIAMHGANNDAFYFYLLTKNGLIECPKIINIGLVHSFNNGNAQGEMKFSIDGKKLAITTDIGNIIEIYEFDKINCIVNNKIVIGNFERSFGVEFSSDSKYLYTTEIGFIKGKKLKQYDLSSNIEQNINNSMKLLLSVPLSEEIPSLQIASDRKIYLIRAGSEYMATIHNPNGSGASCALEDSSIKLPNGANFFYGMPSFPSHYFNHPSLNYTYDMNCGSNMAVFKAQDTFNATQHQWIIASVFTKDTLYGKSVSYTFKDSGYYDVLLIATNGNYTDSVTKRIYINKDFSLGHDTVLCNDTIYWLNAGDGICYKWQDSSLNPNYKVKKSGKCYVSYYNQQMCLVSDTVYIVLNAVPTKPIIYRSNDTLFCSTSIQYQWYRNGQKIAGATNDSYVVKQKGIYTAEVFGKEGCSNISDTLNFDIFTGIADIEREEQTISIYPNPTSGVLHINTDQSFAAEITDALNKTLYKGKEKEIYISAFESGIYILYITTKAKTYIYKIIKQ